MYLIYKHTQIIMYEKTLHVRNIYNYTTTALKLFCNDSGMIIHQRVPKNSHHLLMFKSGCCLSSPAIFLSSTCGLRGTAGLTAFISPAVTPQHDNGTSPFGVGGIHFHSCVFFCCHLSFWGCRSPSKTISSYSSSRACMLFWSFLTWQCWRPQPQGKSQDLPPNISNFSAHPK